MKDMFVFGTHFHGKRGLLENKLNERWWPLANMTQGALLDAGFPVRDFSRTLWDETLIMTLFSKSRGMNSIWSKKSSLSSFINRHMKIHHPGSLFLPFPIDQTIAFDLDSFLSIFIGRKSSPSGLNTCALKLFLYLPGTHLYILGVHFQTGLHPDFTFTFWLLLINLALEQGPFNDVHDLLMSCQV